jgi:uncharacterized protein DUF4145
MTDADAPTLSGYLLNEAKRFLGYPRRVYRSKANLEAHAMVHDLIADLLPWRSTFAPESFRDIAQRTTENEALVDEVYCRELLQAIPGFVHRTRGLATLGFEKIASGPPLVCLQEATRTYIAGFFRAAVALARAAVELALREKIKERFGSDQGDLDQLVDFALRSKLLTDKAHTAASRVRKAGNGVLHKVNTQLDAKDALSIVEDSRLVVLELSGSSS